MRKRGFIESDDFEEGSIWWKGWKEQSLHPGVVNCSTTLNKNDYRIFAGGMAFGHKPVLSSIVRRVPGTSALHAMQDHCAVFELRHMSGHGGLGVFLSRKVLQTLRENKSAAASDESGSLNTRTWILGKEDTQVTAYGGWRKNRRWSIITFNWQCETSVTITIWQPENGQIIISKKDMDTVNTGSADVSWLWKVISRFIL